MDKPYTTNISQPPRKVLFLGNGILRAFGNGARKCQELEHLICEVSGVSPHSDNGSSLIPFPIRIAASLVNKEDPYKALEIAIRDLIVGHKMGEPTTNELLCDSKVVGVPLFRKLLEAGFTDIITTNYGYEIEAVLCGRYPNSQTVKSDFYRNCYFTAKADVTERKFKICKYYRPRDKGIRIWHIHGEYLRPHSIIFEYADYCSLLAKVKAPTHPKGTKNNGGNSSAENIAQEPNWIQTFIHGDVYILGFGAALGEPVFWYLMERRRRNRSQKGNVIFYEPTFDYETNQLKNQQQKAVLAMMTAFGAVPRNMGMTITKDSQFKEFYKKACEDIIAEVKGSTNSCESSERK